MFWFFGNNTWRGSIAVISIAFFSPVFSVTRLDLFQHKQNIEYLALSWKNSSFCSHIIWKHWSLTEKNEGYVKHCCLVYKYGNLWFNSVVQKCNGRWPGSRSCVVLCYRLISLTRWKFIDDGVKMQMCLPSEIQLWSKN